MIKHFLILIFPLILSFVDYKVKFIKIVIFIVVDQIGTDLLSKFENLHNKGIRWLINHGKWYTNTYYKLCYNDTNAPLIFSRLEFKKGLNDSKREAVDVVLSIANYLHVDPYSYCDGKSIKL